MDTAMTDSPERHLWTLIEPVHAITYFAPECQQAFEDAGLPGFWRGYFGGRAAPLGAVSAGAVTRAVLRLPSKFCGPRRARRLDALFTR